CFRSPECRHSGGSSQNRSHKGLLLSPLSHVLSPEDLHAVVSHRLWPPKTLVPLFLDQAWVASGLGCRSRARCGLRSAAAQRLGWQPHLDAARSKHLRYASEYQFSVV